MTKITSDNNLPVWFASSTDYWHQWFNMRDGASAPRDTEAVRERFWREYWAAADAAGYHSGVVHIAPEDDNLSSCDLCDEMAPGRSVTIVMGIETVVCAGCRNDDGSYR